MNPDITRQLRARAEAHDHAFRSLRVANTEMGTANAAMAHAIQSPDEAIQAALSANRAAVDLLERLSGNDRQG